jgi:hypothetical protein
MVLLPHFPFDKVKNDAYGTKKNGVVCVVEVDCTYPNKNIMKEKLEIYERPEITFTLMQYSMEQDLFTLLEGDEVFYDSDDMNNEELEEWARERGILSIEEGGLDEDGEINYEHIRSCIRWEEEEYPQAHNTPTGRAWLYFSNLPFRIPRENGIKLIEGYHPGDNSQFVEIKGWENLIKIQQFLAANGEKVNFELPED